MERLAVLARLEAGLGETEMVAKPFVVAPQDYAPALNLVGEHITVLASGEATGGYEVFLQRGPEGSGPPPHSHPWDESFFVIKGEITFGIGAESRTASAGRFEPGVSLERLFIGKLFKFFRTQLLQMQEFHRWRRKYLRRSLR
jgi:hypothetical protein